MENPLTMFHSEDVIMLKWIIINKVEDNEEREQTEGRTLISSILTIRLPVCSSDLMDS